MLNSTVKRARLISKIFLLFSFGGKANSNSKGNIPVYTFLRVISVDELMSVALIEEGKNTERKCCHSNELMTASV